MSIAQRAARPCGYALSSELTHQPLLGRAVGAPGEVCPSKPYRRPTPKYATARTTPDRS
ncbi:hypothetical protein [Actinacidiphila acididurans]|uniref:Uncharacterized protein n=1 Tax=Actinacidiphila acididurans TaxID=2784346 RepID=A0ABS2TXG7_9ACTN|nr:hypothetical protein [Actinacidiphila acididurans]MBM9506648.1 hypothetical protein [Actinacidiphila acididurans]